MSFSADFSKKRVFWGERGHHRHACKDLETKNKTSYETPMTRKNEQILRMEFWTSSGARQLPG